MFSTRLSVWHLPWSPMRLSIFWRLTIGFLAIIMLVSGVNLFALHQIRQITEFSNALVSTHYPAIDSAKWLIDSIYVQVRNEKKYLAVRDDVFLKHFDTDAREFQHTLDALLEQEGSPDGQKTLKEIETLHDDYRILFHTEARLEPVRTQKMSKEYESQRDAIVTTMTKHLETFVDLHEASISTVINDAGRRSEQAGVVTKQLVILALCLGLLLASLATYSILSPLRRLQEHIRQIGLGNFKTAVNVSAPSDLRELVESVGAMAKKLQELDDLKAEFVSHITHELRSPLTAIHAGTQLLLEEIPGPVTEPQRETLELMVESSRQLIDMISSLLDLSKIDAGMMEYRIVSSDIKRVLDTSVNKIRLLADRERIRIVIEAPRGPVFAPVDETRMQQVLDNLLSNALKFSREGGSIYLRVEPDQKEKVLRISVTDTGRGIAPQSLQYIFERFYQGAVRARGGAPGTGIGLALVKRVVEAHGGRIWADSELGKGTTMSFVLPLSGS
jgi:two-component system, NtrC family, sensor histidine kinase GlrK